MQRLHRAGLFRPFNDPGFSASENEIALLRIWDDLSVRLSVMRSPTPDLCQRRPSRLTHP